MACNDEWQFKLMLINKNSVTGYGDKILSDFYNMLFSNIWLVFSLVDSWIVLVPCSHPCSIEERKRRADGGARGEGHVRVQLSRFLRKTHTVRSFHKPFGTTHRQLFSFTPVFVFILHTVAWSVVKVHQRQKVTPAVSIFTFPSLREFIWGFAFTCYK